MSNNDLHKALVKKFGELAKPLWDERVGHFTYANWKEHFANEQEPLQANPDQLVSIDIDNQVASCRNIFRNKLRQLKLSTKDRKIIDLFLEGFQQNEIASILSVLPQYVSLRMKSICDKLKKIV